MKRYKKYVSCTGKQSDVRRAFRSVVADWRNIKGIVRDSWNFHARNMNKTGFNAFIGANTSARRAGKPMELCKSMGEEPVKDFAAVPGTASGEIICTFLPAGTGNHITIFVRREAGPEFQSDIKLYNTGAYTASPVTISGLEPGAEYHIYAIVTDKRYDDAAKVSGSVFAISHAS